jgi:hypothetical protein
MSKTKRLYQKYYEKTGILITDEPVIDNYYDEVTEDLDDLHEGIRLNPIKYLSQVKKLVKKYPKVPTFKNYLYAAYAFSGQDKKARQIAEETVKQHPRYIFGLSVVIANEEVPREIGRYEKYLGPNKSILDLKDEGVYTVHHSEFFTYQNMLAYFWSVLGEDDKAADAFLPLIELNFPKEEIDTALDRIMKIRMIRRLEGFGEKTHSEIEIEVKSTFQTDISIERPVFKHSEIELFYKKSISDFTDRDREKILALPRQILIDDLKKVIKDSIDRFDFIAEKDYNESEHEAVIHALYFLGELEAIDSLQMVLNLLRVNNEFTEYWFADISEEIFIPVIFSLGKNQLPALFDFVIEENRSSWILAIIPAVVTQVVLHEPTRREEVVNWFREVFDYYLKNKNNKNLFDANFITLTTSYLTEFSGVELIEYIQLFEKENWLDRTFAGNSEEIIAEINKGIMPYNLLPMPQNLGEYYDSSSYLKRRAPYEAPEKDAKILNRLENHPVEKAITKKMMEAISGDFSKEEKMEGYASIGTTETVRRENPKIGRNDPCPCGSGKKYKKCCLRK